MLRLRWKINLRPKMGWSNLEKNGKKCIQIETEPP